jgi:hypothetical protein
MTSGQFDLGVAVLEPGNSPRLHLTMKKKIGGSKVYKTIRVYMAGQPRPEFPRVSYEVTKVGTQLRVIPNFVMMNHKVEKTFDTGYPWIVDFVEASGLNVATARAVANVRHEPRPDSRDCRP